MAVMMVVVMMVRAMGPVMVVMMVMGSMRTMVVVVMIMRSMWTMMMMMEKLLRFSQTRIDFLRPDKLGLECVSTPGECIVVPVMVQADLEVQVCLLLPARGRDRGQYEAETEDGESHFPSRSDFSNVR